MSVWWRANFETAETYKTTSIRAWMASRSCSEWGRATFTTMHLTYFSHTFDFIVVIIKKQLMQPYKKLPNCIGEKRHKSTWGTLYWHPSQGQFANLQKEKKLCENQTALDFMLGFYPLKCLLPNRPKRTAHIPANIVNRLVRPISLQTMVKNK